MFGISHTQAFLLKQTRDESPFRLNGQSISNIIERGDSLWLSTSKSLQLSVDKALNWKKLETGNLASPLKAFIDSKGWFWLSYASDTTLVDELFKGNGLVVNRGDGKWRRLAQPVDDRDHFDSLKIRVPVTTDINNLSYDISETRDSTAVEGRKIWIASFAGSLRFIYADSLLDDDWEAHWHLQTPDGKKLDVAQNNESGLAQRVFSLASDKERLWVGTANGIYYSEDHGKTFINEKYESSDANSLSGNFVTKLDYENGFLYAMSLVVSSGEREALNRAAYPRGTVNPQWKMILENNRSFDLAVLGDSIFAGTEQGLLLSADEGTSWKVFDDFSDNVEELEIIDKSILSLSISDFWWLGSSEGLAYSNTQGKTWTIIKSKSIKEHIEKNHFSSVYPSPFSPLHSEGALSISFRQEESGKVTITVYDFALKELFQMERNRSKSDIATVRWDGKNTNGNYIGNGVYFIKVQTNTDVFWNKLVIIN